MLQYTIKLLGSPAGGTLIGDKAFCLNSLGAAAGLAQLPGPRAVVWNPGPMLLPTGAQHSIACAINDTGDVVGAQGQLILSEWGDIQYPDRAFLYTTSTGALQDLTGLFGAKLSVATDINSSGSIAAWAGDFGKFRAFRYDSGTSAAPVNLGVLAGHSESRANAINDQGHVTGISKAGATVHGFFHDGALNDLGPDVYPNDINDNGQIVGERRVGGSMFWHAFLCETSGGSTQFQDLGTFPIAGFNSSVAMGINSHGDIVGYSFTSPGGGQTVRAFLRPASGPMLDLNSLVPPNSGWLLHRACAINDGGQIVGVGTYDGRFRAYLLIPESAAPIDEAAIDPWALLLTGELYVKLKTLPDPPPELFLDRIRERVRAMGPVEKRLALARVKALGALARALEQELSKQ
jgi:uncharacterized membrane protein